MRSDDKVIAICCADIHLRHKAPLCRAGEPDWYAAMARPLKEIRELAGLYNVPILCAGDIFDRWNSSAELINFAIDHLPYLWAVPGQHDLPLHSYELIERSAYTTLIKSGKIITPLISGSSYNIHDSDWYVTGAGWNCEPYKMQSLNKENKPTILVIHQYAWVDGYSYPDAPESGKISKRRKDIQEFDVVIFGDNHKGFLTKCGDTTVFNCGSLMRTKSDQEDYKSHVGLLKANGEIELHYLDISQDVFTPTESKREAEVDMELEEFLKELGTLQGMSLDFRDVIIEAMDKKEVSPEVRTIILEAME